MDLHKIASRIAIMMGTPPTGSGAIIDTFETHKAGGTSIEFPDGTTIVGEYQITGGKASGYELMENSTSYSEEEALKLLEAAYDYWSEAELEEYPVDELKRRAGV